MKHYSFLLESSTVTNKDWSFVIQKYKKDFNIDLSYMKMVYGGPHYNNGKPCNDLKPEESGGSWTKKKIVYINKDMQSVMDYYKIKNQSLEHFTRIIMAHELAHEVYNNIATESFKNKIVNEAKSKKFHTVYLDHVKENKLTEETFCEYMAHLIVDK